MARRPFRSSSTVLLLFVVAVVTLAILDEPLLVSRVQRVSITSLTSFASFASSATRKEKKKDTFRELSPSPKTPSILSELFLEGFPDFNKYVHTETLTPKSFGLGEQLSAVMLSESCADVLQVRTTSG